MIRYFCHRRNIEETSAVRASQHPISSIGGKLASRLSMFGDAQIPISVLSLIGDVKEALHLKLQRSSRANKLF
jgi:hypothetical protein